LNLKRKRQGYGYYQWEEQMNSQNAILEFLYYLESKKNYQKTKKDMNIPGHPLDKFQEEQNYIIQQLRKPLSD